MPDTKVLFKRGLNAELPKSGIIDGAFYLTTDTHRLYVGQGSSLVELNKSITVVDVVSNPQQGQTALPTSGVEVGQFYYVGGTGAGTGASNTHQGNILAVCTSVDNNGTPTWVQVNPDTNSYISATDAATVVALASNVATIATSVSDTGASTTHTATGTFKIAGGNNVTLSKSDETISGTTVSTITVNAKDTTYDASAYKDGNNKVYLRLTDNAATPNHDDVEIKGAGGVSIDVNNGAIQISGSNPVSSVANSFNSNGELVTTIGIQGSDNIVSNPSVTPTIAYGYASPKSTAVFKDGDNGSTAILNIYTKDEVDNLISSNIQTADAMTYKGTVNSSDAATKLNTAGSTTGTYAGNVGDTYKASAKLTAGQNCPVNAEIGDLIIATGTDGAVTWEVVPSGNDQFISVATNDTNKSFLVQDSSSGSASSIGGIVFANDTTAGNSQISVNVVKDSTNNLLTVTPVHGAAGTGSAVTAGAVTNGHTQGASNFDVPIVTGISKDTHGHITSVTLDTYRFNHAKIDSISHGYSATDAHNGVFVTAVSLDGTTSEGRFNIKSDSLSLSQTSVTTGEGANAVTTYGVDVELVWDSFA